MVPCRGHLATLVLGVAIATSTSCARSQQLSSVSESIDSLMASLQEQGYFVSGAVVAGRNDEVLYERGFGLANVAEGVPFTPDTPSHGASITKTLTATAILMLQEEGRVRLRPLALRRHEPTCPHAAITSVVRRTVAVPNVARRSISKGVAVYPPHQSVRRNSASRFNASCSRNASSDCSDSLTRTSAKSTRLASTEPNTRAISAATMRSLLWRIRPSADQSSFERNRVNGRPNPP